jgi:poly(A) polymerase
MPGVVKPRIVAREEHPISRRDIDPDALKVLYRLRHEYTAYLVGGSVRDLLLSRRRKDFDIGTSAHPYQVRSCSGTAGSSAGASARARQFGQKVIEVATFRRQVAAGEEVVQDGVPAPDPTTPEGEHLIHRDNTFGTPEEDAFRRDFTINALFYDIANFDHRLRRRPRRSARRAGPLDRRSRRPAEGRSGAHDPRDALAARLDFTIEPTLLASIRAHRQEIAKSCCRGCSRSTTRSCGRDRPRRRFAASPKSGCCSRFRRSCTRARPSRSGRRSPRSIPTAAASTRPPSRCRTASCSAACWCRSASP